MNGNVIIKGDLINVATFDAAHIPQLKIIADNIYIEKTASRIDAELVAYPSAAVTTTGVQPGLVSGVIDTCSDGTNAGTWGTNLTVDYCNRRLVVNGSLIAQTILWKGTFGTVGGGTDSFNNSCPARDETCASEYVNFRPEIYISRFNNGPAADIGKALNTIELPPIY